MSNNLQSLNRRIAGAGDLQGVVRSMKALAASSIGQYEQAVQALADYFRTVELGLAACLRQAGAAPGRLAQGSADCGAVGAVVFGSDQGLVGRFNEVLAEFAISELGKLSGKVKKIWAVGERIHALMADASLGKAGLLAVPSSINGITSFVGQTLIDIEKAREHGDVVEVFVFHNHPQAGAVYEPIGKRLLPLDHLWRGKLAALPWPTKNVPEAIGATAGSGEGELEAFIREYLFVSLFQACAESLASENASRLAAMQRAEKNIEDVLDDLNRKFHRIRQESIDEELFDVISGFEALSVSHKLRF